MKTPARYFLSLFLLLAMMACSGQSKRYEAENADFPASSSRIVAESFMPQPAPEVAGQDGGGPATEQNLVQKISQQIIRDGQAVFETNDLKKTKTWIESLVQKHKAYLSLDEQSKGSDRIEQRMIVRIPADRFDAFVADLEKGVVKFDSKSITATDVTEEFIDVSQRLRLKKETEERYIALLEKAKSVQDVLETEKYIGQVRAEIESLEGRLKYLQNRIGLSTLNITFYQLKPEVQEFTSRIGLAFSEGWNNFLFFLLGVISLWPFLLAGVLLVGTVRFLWKLRK
ncbi:DUF4349 domain-containing protein [Chlorobaculum parvum]|nr:DUF4349 domain-containing protein [Chlorobaculum parvum]